MTRPELAAVDGMAAPAGLPRGEFYSTIDDDGTFHIDQADPQVLISEELINEVAYGLVPHAELDLTSASLADTTGALLKIRGANQQVVYRLTEWVPAIRAYIGAWPE